MEFAGAIQMGILRQLWSDFTASTVPPQYKAQYNDPPDPPLSSDYLQNIDEVPMQPLYFVTHPDGSFSVANPQPVLNPREERAKFHELEVQRFENEQRKWLLSIAPMIEVPPFEREFICRGRSPFGYIHPKTFAKQNPSGKKTFTKWIATSLMPEDRVIYSPFPLPGTERRYEMGNRNSRKPCG